jgi:AcrR family transcriptional regulator
MASTDRKEREKEQRKNAIIDAAEKLFFSRGFDNVSMEDIAKEVELGKGTLYLYFQNKDSLFFAIALRKAHGLHKKFTECMESGGCGREKSHRMGESLFEFAKQNQDYYRMVCTVGPTLFRKTDNLDAKEVLDLMVKDLCLHRDVLREGMEDGTVRSDLHPLEMAVFLSIMSMSVTCLDPAWKKLLGAEGISYGQFMADYLVFIGNAVDKLPDAGELNGDYDTDKCRYNYSVQKKRDEKSALLTKHC